MRMLRPDSIRRAVPAVLASVCVFVSLLTAQAGAAPTVWVVPSLERIRPDDPPGPDTHIDLYAAKGEYESFQIIVRAPAGGLTNVDVSGSDLAGPGAAAITAANLTFYREHYVYVSNVVDWGLNRPEGPGWYPDGLIPFVDPETGADLVGAPLDAVPFDLPESKNQPLWIDVFVPRTAPAGQYTGLFTITSDQGDASVDLTLTVWDFELPLRPSLKSAIGLDTDYIVRGEELLRNKLMPRHVDHAEEPRLVDDLGLSCANAGYWSGADLHTCWMAPVPTVAEFQAEAASHDPRLFLYDYIADEIDDCIGLHPAIKEWARNVHEAGIDCLITMTPTPDLYDDGSGTGRSAVDIWVLLPSMYDAAKAEVAAVLAKGDEVWSYNDLNQDDYSPKWLLDFAPINYRIQAGFINQSLGLTGLLYWRADLWTADPWNDVNAYSDAYPGEGLLLYPGEQVGISGVCPSMRLKWMRDGVEDYEYIQLYREQGKEEFALSVAAAVGADWSNWTRDPAVLEAARRQLGEACGWTFYDVPPDYWAYDEIQAAYQSNVAGGYPNGSYQPTWDVSRAQMAVFIARALLAPGGEDALTSYTPPATPTYWDVSPSYWSFEHIEYITEAGVVEGYPDDAYRPTTWVTRDQMAVYIARAITAPSDPAALEDYIPPEEPTFQDVPTDQWAYKHIEYLAEQGIVQGYPGGWYLPDRKVTRSHMAVYIARAFNLL